MTNVEKYTPNERGSRLYETTRKATRMIIERMNLENLGLNLKTLPLCSENDAEMIESFIPRAKDGFALSLKSIRVMKGETTKLLKQTTPIAIPNSENRIMLLESENTLPEYAHTVATLGYLLSLRRVTFLDFTDIHLNIDPGIGLLESYWNFNTFSVDHIWSIMLEIEKITRDALYKEDAINISELLKVGHFFAAGNELSKIFPS